MLRSLKDLEGYTVTATDGDIGAVVDLLLDDERWVARYLVVGATRFDDGRRVLVSPLSFLGTDWATRRFHVALTTDKVRQCPSVDVDRPVTRQQERLFHEHYGYPMYWGAAGLLELGNATTLPPTGSDKPADVHLRSARTIRGYDVQGTDESVGRVEDFIVDDETWEIRYMAIDTNHWWFGKKVLIAPQWADSIKWDEKKLHVGLSRQAVKDSPEWEPNAAINRRYETRLYDYYGRPAYWDSDVPTPDSPMPRRSEVGIR